jgi:hypothetical protein
MIRRSLITISAPIYFHMRAGTSLFAGFEIVLPDNWARLRLLFARGVDLFSTAMFLSNLAVALQVVDAPCACTSIPCSCPTLASFSLIGGEEARARMQESMWWKCKQFSGLSEHAVARLRSILRTLGVSHCHRRLGASTAVP